MRAHGTRPAPPERFPRGYGARRHERDQILLAKHGAHGPGSLLARQSQLRQQNARAQGWTFLNSDVVLLKQPDVGGDLKIFGLLAGHDAMKAESADVVDLVKTYVAQLNGSRRFLRCVRQMVIFEQVNVSRLRPMTASAVQS